MEYTDWRCPICHHLLCRVSGDTDTIEIKCKKCRSILRKDKTETVVVSLSNKLLRETCDRVLTALEKFPPPDPEDEPDNRVDQMIAEGRL